MLLKGFYKIQLLESKGENKYLVRVLINEKHDVFKGHFPENPIMPGVCMMQIIKEIMEGITRETLTIVSLSNVKFIELINPFITPELLLELEIKTIDDQFFKVKNTTYFDEVVALKLVSVYKKK